MKLRLDISDPHPQQLVDVSVVSDRRPKGSDVFTVLVKMKKTSDFAVPATVKFTLTIDSKAVAIFEKDSDHPEIEPVSDRERVVTSKVVGPKERAYEFTVAGNGSGASGPHSSLPDAEFTVQPSSDTYRPMTFRCVKPLAGLSIP